MDDWNWFFSALQQSAAAIVGLGGAFLVTKIVGNESDYKRSVALTEQMLDEAESLQDKLGQRYFDWYNRHSRKADINRLWTKLEEKRGKNADFLAAAEYYETESFSPFIPRAQIVAQIESVLERLREPPPPRRSEFDLMALTPPGITVQIEQQLSASVQQERELIDQLVVEVDHHIRRVKRLHGVLRTNPESSPLISWAIAANLCLFTVAVLYPLGWLPLSGRPVLSFAPSAAFAALISIRGALLTAFAAIFGASMFLFWRTNARLRYSPELLELLARRSSRGSYSEYLRIFDENQRAQAPRDKPADDGEGVG